MFVYKSARFVGTIVFLIMTTVVNAAEPKIPSLYTAIETGDVSPDDNGFEKSEVVSIFIGGQGEKFSFELGYVDLGKYEFLELTEDDDEVNGLQFSLRRVFPVKDPITLYLGLGFLIEEVTGNPFSFLGYGESVYVDSSSVFGFGATLDLSETFGGRVAFRRYNDTSAERLDTLTFGLYMRF